MNYQPVTLHATRSFCYDMIQRTLVDMNTPACPETGEHVVLVYATREPPKMVQFDWFAISGYRAMSHD